ncbi:hypothetical protein [Paenibacillus sp. MER 99-2]|uniref:hypothetical protein n=1 Tax=Paenibacillus sp. MER 99-2 TaxID=2939572 RepID=UPI00203DDA9C|nr:hypothetical protein [Paenibacillus sp. MER 99-2]MCM3176217.1 hypothetical protein [Paenibacillus sp. MER 99-2]
MKNTQNEVASTNEVLDITDTPVSASSFLPQVNNEGALVSAFTDVSNVFYSSIVDDGTRQTKAKIYTALNNSEGNFSELKEPIVVQDIMAHNVQLADDQTGEIIETVRIVLVTPEGKGYHAMSQGVMSSIQKIVGMYGAAPWVPGIKMMPRSVTTRRKFKTVTIDIIAD